MTMSIFSLSVSTLSPFPMVESHQEAHDFAVG